MGNIHALAHRVTAISVATLATAGFLFCFLGGFSCNFLAVNPEPGRKVMTPDGLEFPTESSAYLGVQCDSPFYQESDHMWNMSQLFLYIGLCVGGLTTLLAWVISIIIPPTAFTWRTLSVLSACAAVIGVPIFLIFESEPCAMDINRQTCSVATGAYLNIVSITLYVGMTLWTQFLLPPDWTKETKAWRNTNREVKVGEISIPSGESRDGNGTEDETAPHEASPSSPPPLMNWGVDRQYVQTSPLEKRNSVDSRREAINQHLDSEAPEEFDHPVFAHSSSVTTNLYEIEGLTVEDQMQDTEENEQPQQETVRRSFWSFRRNRTNTKKEETEEMEVAENSEGKRIIMHDLEEPEITLESVEDQQVAVESLEEPMAVLESQSAQEQEIEETQTPASIWNSSKERRSSNSDQAPNRASFWSLRRPRKDEPDDNESVPRPVYTIPLSWDAEDIEIPPPVEVYQEESVEENDVWDNPDEPRMSCVPMMQGAAVVMASLKETTHALADKVRKVSHREPQPTQKSKGIKFTIIGPDGVEERRKIGRQRSQDRVVERMVPQEPPAEQVVTPKESPVEHVEEPRVAQNLAKKGSRDVVVTHSIPRKHASVPLEREDTIPVVKSASLNVPKRVQSSPVHVTPNTPKHEQEMVAPPETLALQPPSQTMSFDAVSEITPAPLPHEDIPDETLAILADLAQLEQP